MGKFFSKKLFSGLFSDFSFFMEAVQKRARFHLIRLTCSTELLFSLGDE